jgi:hypothetical protein
MRQNFVQCFAKAPLVRQGSLLDNWAGLELDGKTPDSHR